MHEPLASPARSSSLTGENFDALENRVLVMAPIGNDARLTADFLSNSGLHAYICRDLGALCAEIKRSCAMIVLAEEVLNPTALTQLIAALGEQPAWSDVPVALISSSSEVSRDRIQRLSGLGAGYNVTLLERPFRPTTLLSTVQSGLLARKRQYQVRQLLTEVQQNAQRATLISESSAELLLSKRPDESLPAIFNRLIKALGIDVCVLHVPTPSSNRFKVTFASGLDLAAQAKLASIPNGDAWCRALAAKSDSPELAEWKALTGTQATAAHPLSVADRNFGTAILARKSSVPFSGDELQAFNTVCDLAAASLERRRLLNELSDARDSAEHASRSKDDFLAALSHELRTPLNPIMLLASEAAQNPDIPPVVRDDFEMIRKNVNLEARLIDDLLDLTRITRGKLLLDPHPLELQNVLLEAVETTRPDALEKEIEVRLDLQTPGAVVSADEVRLLQVFWNVLKNAVKFTPPGGRIEVRTREIVSTNRVAIEVADSGVGMTPDEISRAFNPFAQGDHASLSSTHRFGGLGLGLAISNALVGLHSGSISATSEGRNLGAVVRIELPLLSSSEPLDAPVSAPRQIRVPSQTGMRILLVEDHDNTRTSLTRLLSRRGYSVKAAGSLASARKLAEEETFDVLVSDLGLPDGTGYDLMSDLKKTYALKGIALSGYGMEQDLKRSRDAGFVDHLVKPVEIAVLDSSLHRLFASGN